MSIVDPGDLSTVDLQPLGLHELGRCMWVDGAFAAGRLAGERFPIGFRYTSTAKLDLTSVDSILNSANRGCADRGRRPCRHPSTTRCTTRHVWSHICCPGTGEVPFDLVK